MVGGTVQPAGRSPDNGHATRMSVGWLVADGLIVQSPARDQGVKFLAINPSPFFCELAFHYCTATLLCLSNGESPSFLLPPPPPPPLPTFYLLSITGGGCSTTSGTACHHSPTTTATCCFLKKTTTCCPMRCATSRPWSEKNLSPARHASWWGLHLPEPPTGETPRNDL